MRRPAKLEDAAAEKSEFCQINALSAVAQ